MNVLYRKYIVFPFLRITRLTRIQLKHFESVICRKKSIQWRGTRILNVIYPSNCTPIVSRPVHSVPLYTFTVHIFYYHSAHKHTLTPHTVCLEAHVTSYTGILGHHLYGCSIQVPVLVRTGINFLQGTPSHSECRRLGYA